MTREEHDRLWQAVCRVTAAYESYRRPDRARPAKGLFFELDRLDQACAELTRLSDELVPVPPTNLEVSE
jgi:hypothetical protein